MLFCAGVRILVSWGYDNKLLYYTHQAWYDHLFPCRAAGLDLEKMRKRSNWYKEAMNVYIPM